MVVSLGALLADVPHTRGAGDRERDRPGAGRAARPLDLPLRGTDRDRRRPPRRLPRGRHPVGEPVGRGAALRLAGAEPARGEGAVRAARRHCSTPRSTRTSSTRRPRPTSSRSARRSRPTRRRPRTSRSWSAAPTRLDEERTFLRARRSPPSSRASCRSARREARGGTRAGPVAAPGGAALAEGEGVARDPGVKRSSSDASRSSSAAIERVEPVKPSRRPSAPASRRPAPARGPCRRARGRRSAREVVQAQRRGRARPRCARRSTRQGPP